MLDLIIIIRQGACVDGETKKLPKTESEGERNVGFLGFHSLATQAETCCRPDLMKDRAMKDERWACCEQGLRLSCCRELKRRR